MGSPSDADADAPPPSYTEAITTTSPSSSTGLPLPSPLTSQLHTLPERLHLSETERQATQNAQDYHLAALMVPHVDAFLAELTGRAARTPRLAELILVPASAVPEGFEMGEMEQRNKEGEFVRFARVEVDLGGGEKGGEGKGKGRRVGDGEGRGEGGEQWWFSDEEMAGRLAKRLRPEPDLERKKVQAVVAETKAAEKGKSRFEWLKFGSSRKPAAPELTPPPPPVTPSPPVSPALSISGWGGRDDSVKMTVSTDKFAFRKENELGLSVDGPSGYGVVVTVRVKP